MVQGGSAKLFAQTQLPEDLIEDPVEDLVEKKDNDSVMDLAEIAELDLLLDSTWMTGKQSQWKLCHRDHSCRG